MFADIREDCRTNSSTYHDCHLLFVVLTFYCIKMGSVEYYVSGIGRIAAMFIEMTRSLHEDVDQKSSKSVQPDTGFIFIIIIFIIIILLLLLLL